MSDEGGLVGLRRRVSKLGVQAAVACGLAFGLGACLGGDDSTAASVDRCVGLAAMELIDFDIVSARNMPGEGDTPAHCRVHGLIDTDSTFELSLPDDWNGRFMMGGWGGTLGTVERSALSSPAGPSALERGYATVGTDGRLRSTYLTAEASLSIIRHYYERAPVLTPESLPRCLGDIAGPDCLTTAQRRVLEAP
jgi:hypothetical protein|tara:strand:+ start:2670 stop:3251 length:582 start_codon:yes stop_codon:yes gene_type:complete